MRFAAEGVKKKGTTATSAYLSEQSSDKLQRFSFTDENLRIFALSRPKSGEMHNGDCYFMKKCDDRIIVAVVDALGHGKKAEEASRIAVEFMENSFHRNHMNIEDMIKGLHHALKGTRGAVIGISEISGEELSFVGVGNITAQIANEHIQAHIPSISGVLGWNLRYFRVFNYHFTHGWLVMNSDGIKHFILSRYLSDDLRQMAENIIDAHGKEDDDATILILKKCQCGCGADDNL